jgi:O-antigen/teichoic acid export membrane protein
MLMIPLSLTVDLFTTIFFSTGKQTYFMVLNFFATIINISLSYVWIIKFGIVGAVWATSLAHLFIIIFGMKTFNMRQAFSLQQVLKVGAGVVVSVGIVMGFKTLGLPFMVSGVTGLVGYGVTLFLVKEDNVCKAIKEIK